METLALVSLQGPLHPLVILLLRLALTLAFLSSSLDQYLQLVLYLQGRHLAVVAAVG